MPTSLEPEDRWALGPFLLSVSIWAMWPCKLTNILFQTLCRNEWCLLFYCVVLFLPLPERIRVGEFDFRKQPAGPEAREKGCILAEA
jgi:hypothetical protein